MRATLLLAVVGGAVAVSGCGSNSSPAAEHSTAATPQVVHVDLVGKTDADSGAPGTYTAKEGWPAWAPDKLSVPANSTVVLTIKEYDAAATPLPDGSQWNKVQGGTETVDGQPVTSVSNDKIAHTFTIPELGINAPIPMAPDGGVTTIVFTFQVGSAGTYTFECLTPCGGDPNGMGGAMATMGWMKGQLTVA